MFLYAFLLLCAYLILKPVRNSLFLVRFGPEQLPLMYVLIAVIATPLAALYGKASTKLSLPRLIGWTTGIIVVCLAIFWWLITEQVDGLVYVFYVWVSLFGVFTTSQFWLLANYVFDAREAKRLFPFIGAGAITGGIAGSKMTAVLADLIGTENLLWICIVCMIGCFGLLMAVWRLRKVVDKPARRKRVESKAAGMWPIVRKSRHLQLLTAIISVTVIVSTFVDFQFNMVVKDAFETKDQLTAFFGDFFFYLSIVSLGLQLLFSSRILRRFGVGAAIMFLPLGLLLGSAAIFLQPVLWAAVAVKLSDGSFRYSINKSGMELLYMPVPAQIKSRVKAFLDVVGDRFARGLGGGLLYLFYNTLNWSVSQIALLSGGLIGVWLLLTIIIKGEYSRSFRSALERRTLDSDRISVHMQDADSIAALTRSLKSSSVTEIQFGLGLTEQIQSHKLVDPLLALLTHSEPTVRKDALRQLVLIGGAEHFDRVEPLLDDESPAVRSAAIHFLYRHYDTDRSQRLKELLANKDPVLKASAFRSALENRFDEQLENLISLDEVEELLDAEEPSGLRVRREVSYALRFASRGSSLTRLLPRLMVDPDPDVRRNALSACGTMDARNYLTTLVGYLGDPSLRSLAGESITAYGSPILPSLAAFMEDPTIPYGVRVRIPKIISLIGGQEAVDLLFEQLDMDETLIRYQVIKGLNRARRNDPKVIFDQARIESLWMSELRQYLQNSLYHEVVSKDKSASTGLLARALDERRQQNLELAFRFTGLLYQPDDMLNASRGTSSKTSVVRSRAIEFLDTIWSEREKTYFFPILERSDNLKQIGASLFNLRTSSDTKEVTSELLKNDNPWLAACAAWVVGQQGWSDNVPQLERLLESSHIILRETAQASLEKLSVT